MDAKGDQALKDQDIGVSLAELESARESIILPAKGQLPILSLENDFGRLLNVHQTLLVLGETGSGKSTQIPQMLVRLGWANRGFRVAVIQPNKLTAVRLSERLILESGNQCFVECVTAEEQRSRSNRNSPVVVFDQTAFLRKALAMDATLGAFSIVFLDEVHQRSANMDLICGLLKRVLEFRDDLRLVCASATMDTKSIARFFTNCATLVCEGRNFSIQLAYLNQPCWNYLDRAASVIRQLHRKEPLELGDVLVFVPTREDCDELVRMLSGEDVSSASFSVDGLLPVPLHDKMSLRELQTAIMATQHGKRKVIVATDIAETSVTIPNIAFVVDTMFVHEAVFDGQSGLVTMETRAISKSRANQRAGRAGRIAPGGKCIRLCTETDFRGLLPRHETAQITRSDLVDVVLFLKSLGIEDVVDFPFISMPPSDAFIRAFDILYALDALDDEAQLTVEGRQLAMLPVSASLGRMLWKSFEFPGLMPKVLDLVAIIASGVAAPALASCTMATLATFAAREGDHNTLCNLAQGALEANKYWKAMSFERLETFKTYRVHLRRVVNRVKGPIDWNAPRVKQESDARSILTCVVSGFFTNAAKLQSNGLYKTIRDGRIVRLHPSSVLARLGKPPEWICFHEAVLLSKQTISQMDNTLQSRSSHHRDEDDRVAVVRIASAIDPRWLLDVAPHFYKRIAASSG